MTKSGINFFLFLIINAVIAIGYLCWFLLYKKETENRRQYIMHTIIMLLCPLVGILYFLCGWLKYHFLRWGERDLSDVEFSKKRRAARMKANEERERNIVSVEESIHISDQEKKRTNMLNVLLGETEDSLAAIAIALDSDDSEVAHYAASFLQSKMDTFRENVRKARQQIEENDIEEEDCKKQVMDLIWYMNKMLSQRVFVQVEQRDYVEQMEELCGIMYEHGREQMPPACYESILGRLMELREYDRAEVWGKRFNEEYKDQLSAYTLLLKLYFETHQKDKFFDVLGELRVSDVVVDNKTLKLIRMVQI